MKRGFLWLANVGETSFYRMFNNQIFTKVLIIFFFFILCQMLIMYLFSPFIESKMTLEAEVQTLQRKKDELNERVTYLEREKNRLDLRFKKIDYQ